MLRVLNRELDADFDLDAFEHVARLEPDEEWIEMRLRAERAQIVHHRAPRTSTCDFAAGEELRTEISAKFRRDGVERELAAAGLQLAEWWTDPAGDFALSLSFARCPDQPRPDQDDRCRRTGRTDVPARAADIRVGPWSSPRSRVRRLRYGQGARRTVPGVDSPRSTHVTGPSRPCRRARRERRCAA